MADLTRFLDAQQSSFKAAMSELRTGRKRSHWMWWIFPQIAGLGTSPTSVRYAIADIDEARAYLEEPTLRARLLEAVSTAYEQIVSRKVPITTLMGSDVDALKLVSSLTLFASLAKDVEADLTKRAEAILSAAEAQGLPRCAHTLKKLGF